MTRECIVLFFAVVQLYEARCGDIIVKVGRFYETRLGDMDRNVLYCLQWSDFMKLGEESSDDVLQQRIINQSVNKYCALIYTVNMLNLSLILSHAAKIYFAL